MISDLPPGAPYGGTKLGCNSGKFTILIPDSQSSIII